MPYHLSKSRFVAGWLCPNELWWRVHEPDAPELVPDVSLQDRLNQGNEVGELACTYVPGGVLIDLPHNEVDERLAMTREALDGDAPAIYEASFLADNVFVAVDILERTGNGYSMIEVKSSTQLKDEHLPDAAIQTHVLRQSGLDVRRAEVMHLNNQCRYPDLGDLFTRVDVTEQIRPLLPDVPDQIAQQMALINGPEPEIEIGHQCFGRRECPFKGRCWPDMSGDHVGSLSGVGPKKTWELMQRGYHSIHDLTPDVKIPRAAERQVRAVKKNKMIIGRGFAEAMQQFAGTLAFLDFETVSRAIPVWDGCWPWQQVPVQFSCHVQTTHGEVTHHEWLAQPGRDPREELALAMIEACRGADKVVAWYASFERTRIDELIEALPHLADELRSINERLVDPHRVVKDYVYDPAFHGSFSIKNVLPALVPELSYGALEISEGATASVELSRFLFQSDTISQEETEKLRHALLEYCKLDTWACVRLLEKLRELVGESKTE